MVSRCKEHESKEAQVKKDARKNEIDRNSIKTIVKRECEIENAKARAEVQKKSNKVENDKNQSKIENEKARYRAEMQARAIFYSKAAFPIVLFIATIFMQQIFILVSCFDVLGEEMKQWVGSCLNNLRSLSTGKVIIIIVIVIIGLIALGVLIGKMLGAQIIKQWRIYREKRQVTVKIVVTMGIIVTLFSIAMLLALTTPISIAWLWLLFGVGSITLSILYHVISK